MHRIQHKVYVSNYLANFLMGIHIEARFNSQILVYFTTTLRK